MPLCTWDTIVSINLALAYSSCKSWNFLFSYHFQILIVTDILMLHNGVNIEGASGAAHMGPWAFRGLCRKGSFCCLKKTGSSGGLSPGQVVRSALIIWVLRQLFVVPIKGWFAGCEGRSTLQHRLFELACTAQLGVFGPYFISRRAGGSSDPGPAHMACAISKHSVAAITQVTSSTATGHQPAVKTGICMKSN